MIVTPLTPVAEAPPQPEHVPGPGGRGLSDWLAEAIAFCAPAILQIVRAALGKRLVEGQKIDSMQWFLDAEDRQLLEESLGAIIGPSDLLGRSRLYGTAGYFPQSAFVAAASEVRPLAPMAAVRYFSPMIPTVRRNPANYLTQLKRDVDAVTVTVEDVLGQQIRKAIAREVETGEDVTLAVRKIITNSGLSKWNPNLAASIVRTQVMDTFNKAQIDQLNQSGMRSEFPVWQWNAIVDERTRPTHRARNDLFYPTSTSFLIVRGESPAEKIGCRCNPTFIHKSQWAKLKAAGYDTQYGSGPFPAGGVRKFMDANWHESDHPRDHAGEFMDKNAIDYAKTFPELRKDLTLHAMPQDVGKLRAKLASPTPTGEPVTPSPTGSAGSHIASPKEWSTARKIAESKIQSAPVPTKKEMAKVRAKLNAWKLACKAARKKGERVPKLREYYDARGGGSAHKGRAKRLFAAHDGDKNGYVVCHGTGRKMHWTDDPVENPNGYPKFEQGKIFVAAQGGDYRDANVLPEHPSYNRARGNAPLRPENIEVRNRDAVAVSKIVTPPTAEHRAVAEKWATTANLPADVSSRYSDDMAHALAAMPGGALREATKAVAGAGGVTFHPDIKSLRAEATKIAGTSAATVVGFAHQRPGGAVAIHVDGDADPRGTYLHEMWHAVDSDGFYSDDDGWQKAYKADIRNGKSLLSRYALTNAGEGFAEFGRVLGERGEAGMAAAFPKCVKYLKSKGLI